jgi:calcineurin-like phosphoesterase family protein
MIYFTSDHHFGHKNIIEYAKRPFANVSEMDEVMFNNWNNTVKKDDLVYYLGDFSFCALSLTKDVLERLHGEKILIRGNHDKQRNKLVGPKLFKEIHQELSIKLENRKVLLCHYPYYPNEQELEEAIQNNYDIRYLERRPKNNGGILLCGHVHEKWKIKDKAINVGVDQWDFTPVSEKELSAFINEELK